MLQQESTDTAPRRRADSRTRDRVFRRGFVALAVVVELAWLLVVAYALVRLLT